MLRDATRSLLAVLVITVACGIAYPLVVWGAAQLMVPDQADGSLVVRDGRVIGSKLIGQPFTSDRYFQGRPSAVGYAAGTQPGLAPASGGTNFGPNSRELSDAIAEARRQVAAREGIPPSAVPVDLVTSSASGLDPDISRDAAMIQVPRVARARGLPRAEVERLVREHTHGSALGLGRQRVRVLALNLALDR